MGPQTARFGPGARAVLTRVKKRRPRTWRPFTAIQMSILLSILFLFIVTNTAAPMMKIGLPMIFWLAANDVFLAVACAHSILCIVTHPDVLYDSFNDDDEYCQVCSIHIAPTTKHCRICDECIDHFDHHCDVFGTCIGEHNHHNFLGAIIFATLFTFSAFAYCVFGYILLDFGIKAADGWLAALGACSLLLLIPIFTLPVVILRQIRSCRKAKQWHQQSLVDLEKGYEENEALLSDGTASDSITMDYVQLKRLSYIDRWNAFANGARVQRLVGIEEVSREVEEAGD